ncbi:MAG: hypothetical protein D6674_07620 [Acidobacteria bacterium]|jgi:ligand-binding SRPBCC domain-containing protein|nr:MAG: hypothetical protein D6674_07620 [Acidobacteriota bacterium]
MEFVHVCTVRAELSRIRSFFKNPQNLLKITPFGTFMTIQPSEDLYNGMKLNLKLFGITLMESLIKDLGPDGFTDVAIGKPPLINYWEHRHLIMPRGSSTVIEDHLYVKSPVPDALLRPLFRIIFSYRCRKIRDLMR